jgi:hypothetical protein
MLPWPKFGPTSVAPAPTISQIYNGISFFMIKNDKVAPSTFYMPNNVAILMLEVKHLIHQFFSA